MLSVKPPQNAASGTAESAGRDVAGAKGSLEGLEAPVAQ